MRTIIVYTSQTGFTARYAQWLAEAVGGERMTIQEAKKKKASFFEEFDCIVYGGWAMAGRIQKADWFLERVSGWRGKKLALFCVGGSPAENPDVDEFLKTVLTEEQKSYVGVFYCQGGICYEKMSKPSKLAMKAFSAMLGKKKDLTEKEKGMAEMISHSYDISDPNYIEPMVAYLRGESGQDNP